MGIGLTFYTPVLLGVAEKHDELVCRKCSKIGNWEDFGKAILESLCLDSSPLPENSIEDLRDILVDVFGCYKYISTIRL